MSGRYRYMTLPTKYVEMAKKSHRIGDGHRPYRRTFSMRSGRPRSMMGNRTPTDSATTVMNSAIRVMGVRHPALLTRRIAEMSVPAWLIPMKKTKLLRYRPHMTFFKVGAIPVTVGPLEGGVGYGYCPLPIQVKG